MKLDITFERYSHTYDEKRLEFRIYLKFSECSYDEFYKWLDDNNGRLKKFYEWTGEENKPKKSTEVYVDISYSEKVIVINL